MSKINDIIQRINNDEEYKTYFFRQAPKYQNLYLWLKPLYDNNHLDSINALNSAYLEKVALENREDEKDEITELLIKIIDNSISNKTNEDWREDWYILKVIFNMPSSAIKLEYMQFIWNALKKDITTRILSSDIVHLVVPVLLENNMREYLLKLIDILFDYKIDNSNKSYQEREPLIEKYWLFDLMNKYSKHIAQEVNIDGLKIVLEIIEKVINQDKGAFNNIWIVTIEKHSQNSFPDRYDNQLVSFTRDLLEVIETNNLKNIVSDLISNQEHPIFKRLAFHTINYHYNDLKDIFWQWFDSEDNILNTTYRHEYCKLLTDRAKIFTDDELQKVLEWIEKLDYSRYYTDDELIFVSAYKKKEWLLCIKDYSNEAEKLYKKYNKIAPEEIEHPCFDSWSSGFHRIDYSHIEDKEAFCNQSVAEIVEYIQNFDPEEIKRDFHDSTRIIEQLAEDFGNCIKNSPLKFSEELSLFDDLDYVHKYYIIYGFSRAWQEKQRFNWKNIFDFIDRILNDDFFKNQDKYKFWLIGAIANLIEYGTLKDDNAFDKSLLPQAKIILFKLLKNRENMVIDNDDWIHYVLNSADGKVLHALISYALRYGRLHSSQKVKWEQEIKDFFTHQLEQDDDYSIFVFTILGQYLDNLVFLDQEWVDSNFTKIFPTENDRLWEVSIDGYFSYSTTVYKNIYTKFKDLGYLRKGIDFKFKQDRTSEKIIQHICIAYMGEFDGETIFDIIQSQNSNNIIEIITFIWHGYRDKYKKEDLEKIHALWKKIFDIFEGESNSEAQDIFSELCKWFVFIEKIDKTNVELLKLSAKYSEKQHNSYFITEELLRLVKDNAKYVGDIYLHMIENNVYPDYKKEDIEETISHLLKSENTNAIKICNKYAQRGIYFLNDLLKEANNEHQQK